MPAKRKNAAKGKEGRPKKNVDPVKAKTRIVGEALEEIGDLPERVQKILCDSLAVSIGQQKETRHPFCERLVEMIGEILNGQQKSLQQVVADRQAAFDGLVPAKGTRETALENAKTDEEQKRQAFDQAKQAVAENLALVKELYLALLSQKKSQEVAEEELGAVALKKDSLTEIQQNSLTPLLEGGLADEERKEKLDTLVEAGKSYSFDKSLMQALVQVLEKSKDARTGFDATCIEQIQDQFASTLRQLSEQQGSATPAKAEREAALASADTAHEASKGKQDVLMQRMADAKDAKEAAIEATKNAKQSLADFMPECKEVGTELDDAKEELEDFTTGALASFQELKAWKEGDFAPPPVETVEEETIDGGDGTEDVQEAASPAKKARTDE